MIPPVVCTSCGDDIPPLHAAWVCEEHGVIECDECASLRRLIVSEPFELYEAEGHRFVCRSARIAWVARF
jgi:hypothetical protein